MINCIKLILTNKLLITTSNLKKIFLKQQPNDTLVQLVTVNRHRFSYFAKNSNRTANNRRHFKVCFTYIRGNISESALYNNSLATRT